jgi:hypothetical protein
LEKVHELQKALDPKRAKVTLYEGSINRFRRTRWSEKKYGLFGCDNIGFNFGFAFGDENDSDRGIIFILLY